MRLDGISLKGIEVFCATARSGSVLQAATEVGLSLPAASQQIKKLEATLGCELLDRKTRPMTTTPAGQVFLSRAREVLRQLQLLQLELLSLDALRNVSLRIGVIEDFENSITPILLAQLSAAMTKCEFRLITGPSHEVEKRLRNSAIDIGIFTAHGDLGTSAQQFDLLRDNFLIVTPRGLPFDPSLGLADVGKLRYITYDRDHIIGRRIEGQLARLKLEQARHVEMDSYQSIYALIATGECWTISTALAYMSCPHFWPNVDIHQLPFPAFSRTIVLASMSEWSHSLARDMAQLLRELLLSHTIRPAHAAHPWLSGQFEVVTQ